MVFLISERLGVKDAHSHNSLHCAENYTWWTLDSTADNEQRRQSTMDSASINQTFGLVLDTFSKTKLFP